MTSDQNLGHVLLWRAPFWEESTPQVIQKAVASDCQSNAVVSCESLQAGGGESKNNWAIKWPNTSQGLLSGKGSERENEVLLGF